jgi:hypothetical protein
VDASVLACVAREVELGDDAADVRLDGLARDDQLAGDPAVGLAWATSASTSRSRGVTFFTRELLAAVSVRALPTARLATDWETTRQTLGMGSGVRHDAKSWCWPA